MGILLCFARPAEAATNALSALASDRSRVRGVLSAALVLAWATAAGAGERKQAVVAEIPEEKPLIAVVSTDQQDVTIYGSNGRIMRSGVSTGRPDHPTPYGVFAVIQKERMHFSNLYGDAPMPFMQRLTWSGVAMHAGYVPDHPDSHGCVRMPAGFAAKLYGLTKVGLRVVVTHNDPEPTPFAHSALFVPLPAVPEIVTSHRTSEAAEAEPVGTMGAVPIKVADTSAAPSVPLPQQPSLSEWLRLRELAKAIAAQYAQRVARETELARGEGAKVAAERDAGERRIADLGRQVDEIGDRMDQLERQGSFARGPEAEARMSQQRQALADRRTQILAEIDAIRASQDDRAQDYQDAMALASEAEQALAKAQERAKVEARNVEPVTVFVSRKAQKVFVRQGFQPVLEAPIAIADPNQPIGTYVYTVMAFDDATGTARWSVLTAAGEAAALRSAEVRPSKRRGAEAPVAVVPSGKAWPLTPASALDRLSFSDDLKRTIGGMLTPGSSIIVSDQGVSSETGKGTDIVVVTR